MTLCPNVSQSMISPTARQALLMLKTADATHHERTTALLTLAAKAANGHRGAREVVQAGVVEVLTDLLRLDHGIIFHSTDDHRHER